SYSYACERQSAGKCPQPLFLRRSALQLVVEERSAPVAQRPFFCAGRTSPDRTASTRRFQCPKRTVLQTRACFSRAAVKPGAAPERRRYQSRLPVHVDALDHMPVHVSAVSKVRLSKPGHRTVISSAALCHRFFITIRK